MIDQFVNATAIAALNRLLAQEAWARAKLAPFAGRSARFEAAPFALHFRIETDGSLGAGGDEPAAVTIGMRLADLPFALGDPQALMRNVSLAGDAEFAQALAFVLQNLRPDPEEPLSRFIGDAAAQRVVGLLRTSAGHWRDLADRMLANGAAYFVAENPAIVGADEVARFNADVARLRDDVARLGKRIELSEKR